MPTYSSSRTAPKQRGTDGTMACICHLMKYWENMWRAVMLLAGWMHLSDTNSNLLILAGMVGFLTGVTRTPFTSAILVLEMTDRHNVIMHLMVAGMVANLVSLLIDRHSLYDHMKKQYLQE